MRFQRLYLLLIAILYAFTASAQLRGNNFVNGMMYSYADTSIRANDFHLMYVYRYGEIALPVILDGIVDFDGSSKKLSRDERKAREIKEDSMGLINKAYTDSLRKKVRVDTIVIAVDKRILKYAGSFKFRVTIDGKQRDWQNVDFSQANRLYGDSYMLCKLNSFGHKYEIEVYTGDGKSFVQITHTDVPGPEIWGVFFKEQKQQIVDLNIIGEMDSNAVARLPRVPYEKYQNFSSYDTFGRDPFLYYLLYNVTRPAPPKNPFRIPTSLDIPSSYNSIIFLLDGKFKDTIRYEYRLVKKEEVEKSDLPWIKSDAGSKLVELNDIAPGEYTLQLRYDHFNSYIINYSITIRPQWYQTPLFSWLRGFFVGLFSVLIIFWFYRQYTRRKIKNKETQQKITALQLQSFRSQLNPHFVFNALSSIQNLVNQNDNARANEYLTKFGSLLRMTLDQGKAEYWSLEDEVDLLRKYIALEQLRFNFDARIEVAAELALQNISFPSMLLQPTVENAIKHGISGIPGSTLHVTIQAKGTDLLITIMDNGNGFDRSNKHTGNHGISLTEDRIAVVNEMRKTQPIEYKIDSTASGTTVTFYLYNYTGD